jgi:hypothetical protein
VAGDVDLRGGYVPENEAKSEPRIRSWWFECACWAGATRSPAAEPARCCERAGMLDSNESTFQAFWISGRVPGMTYISLFFLLFFPFPLHPLGRQRQQDVRQPATTLSCSDLSACPLASRPPVKRNALPNVLPRASPSIGIHGFEVTDRRVFLLISHMTPNQRILSRVLTGVADKTKDFREKTTCRQITLRIVL